MAYIPIHQFIESVTTKAQQSWLRPVANLKYVPYCLYISIYLNMYINKNASSANFESDWTDLTFLSLS